MNRRTASRRQIHTGSPPELQNCAIQGLEKSRTRSGKLEGKQQHKIKGGVSGAEFIKLQTGTVFENCSFFFGGGRFCHTGVNKVRTC